MPISRGVCYRFGDRLTRRKRIIAAAQDEERDDTRAKLSRCLTLVDLTAIGVGTTLGAGAYVLAGQVAKRDAGPAVVISFFIAAITSILSGLCYAEFGARVPKAGSAYLYTYVTVSELMAFVIGWNMILEYVIGTAGVARTATGYLDVLVGDKLGVWARQYLPLHTQQLAPYVDLIAFALIILLTALLASGVKESALFTKLFTGLNLLVLGYVIVMGAFQYDPANWSRRPDEIPAGVPCGHQRDASYKNNETFCGDGGFAPYGVAGVIKGAATCFFAFVGFDAIATAGEEAKNPQRNIPLATIISLLVVFAVYFGISVTITMMTPYYALDMGAPFAAVFDQVGWHVSAYIVSVGAIFALTTSLVGGMFPMPRVIFAMARDGLLFRFLARVDQRVKTPVRATLVSGFLVAVMAMVFDVDALVEMFSIGTLLAYTLVAISVIILRYDFTNIDQLSAERAIGGRPSSASLTSILLKSMINRADNKSNSPTEITSRTAKYLTFLLSLLVFAIGLLLNFAGANIFLQRDWWAITAFVLFLVLIGLVLVLITRQPQDKAKLKFKTPLVPFLPAISVFANLYLMMNLEPLTWVRFAVWMAIGFLIYFGYGMWHSTEEVMIGNQQVIIRDCNTTSSIQSGRGAADDDDEVDNSYSSFHL